MQTFSHFGQKLIVVDGEKQLRFFAKLSTLRRHLPQSHLSEIDFILQRSRSNWRSELNSNTTSGKPSEKSLSFKCNTCSFWL